MWLGKRGNQGAINLSSSAGYELRLMERRRKATLGELEEGERQMKQAQERMKKEAEERGEKPLEDQAEEKKDEPKGSEVVLASQAVVAKEGSKGTPKAKEVSPQQAQPSSDRSCFLPRHQHPPEDFASAAKVTPHTKVTPEFERVHFITKANGPARSFRTGSANSVSGQKTGEAERGSAFNRSPTPEVAPLFTQDEGRRSVTGHQVHHEAHARARR